MHGSHDRPPAHSRTPRILLTLAGGAALVSGDVLLTAGFSRGSSEAQAVW